MAKVIKARIKNSVENGCACSGGSCCSPKSEILKTDTALHMNDYLGAIMVRWGINRSNYKVTPGLYSIGEPDDKAPVFVTANYKLTFDTFRKQLGGLHAYILVLDTKGVNVWCAAGKGTFGTEELISKINSSNLKSVISHKNIILPQLGASGVAAHVVTEKTGFKVIYGPVRAEDIRDFLQANMKAAEKMRTVNFTVIDRAVLIPVELVASLPKLLILYGVFFLLNFLNVEIGFKEFLASFGAVFIGAVLTPILLPFIPAKAFSMKGAILGFLFSVWFLFLSPFQFTVLEIISYIILIPSISAYLSLNFTGCSTYTSPSGVNKEMRYALPILIVAGSVGALLFILNLFLKGVHIL